MIKLASDIGRRKGGLEAARRCREWCRIQCSGGWLETHPSSWHGESANMFDSGWAQANNQFERGSLGDLFKYIWTWEKSSL